MKVAQADDKIKTIGQFTRKMQEMAVTQFRLMVAIDFSISNQWQKLHQLSDPARNGYLQVLGGLAGIVRRYVKNGYIPAFRFGCRQSEDYDCVPLCAPQNPNPNFEGFDALMAGYAEAVQSVEMYGPTQLTPVFQKAVQVSAETGHQELLVCVILTDGDVEDIKLDRETLVMASQYPICFVGVGIGNGDFKDLEPFDDLKLRKFDNFQFVHYDEVAATLRNGRFERPDLVLALAMFNEIPAAVKKMRMAKILK